MSTQFGSSARPSESRTVRPSRPFKPNAIVGAIRLGSPSQNASAVWYGPHLERRHENADVRCADLRQLEAIASDEAGAPLKDDDYLVLSTIHSAKGQEWKTVHVLNVVDGCMPSDMATGSSEEIDEERRLLYVAMTRAKDHLTLVVPSGSMCTSRAAAEFGTSTRQGRGSLPDALAAWFERGSWPVVANQSAQGARRPPAVDLAARLRGDVDVAFARRCPV